MIALERFHLRHGHYPESLEVLVPELLDTVPVDPWDPNGAAFRFAIKFGRPAVWSVSNGEEFGGIEEHFSSETWSYPELNTAR